MKPRTKKIGLKVFNEAKGFRTPVSRLNKAFSVFLRGYGRKISSDGVSVIFVEEKAMKALNEQWKGGEGATDVLSFDYGEIYICPKVADKYAKEFGAKLMDEILFLFVHGLLHLAGFTHENEQKFAIMMKITGEILK